MEEDTLFPYVRKCKKCGKEIFPTAGWVYKKNGNYYCSWKCFRQHYPDKPKKNILLPKVGDTIEILYVSGIPSLSNKVGVVQFYDSMGQLHGTWGGLVIVPGEDRYRIIAEAEVHDD